LILAGELVQDTRLARAVATGHRYVANTVMVQRGIQVGDENVMLVRLELGCEWRELKLSVCVRVRISGSPVSDPGGALTDRGSQTPNRLAAVPVRYHRCPSHLRPDLDGRLLPTAMSTSMFSACADKDGQPRPGAVGSRPIDGPSVQAGPINAGGNRWPSSMRAKAAG
jgi:hypothetical protein